MSPSALPPIVLAFAAADPTGGAGVQADLLTLASMGCHALSVITAITVQDTAGVENLQAIDSDWVVDQARLVLEDRPVASFRARARTTTNSPSRVRRRNCSAWAASMCSSPAPTRTRRKS